MDAMDGTRKGFLGVHRSSWIAIGVSLLLVLILALWAVFSAVSWVIGKMPAAADAGREAAGAAIEKVGQAVPAVRDGLGAIGLPGSSGSQGKADGAARDVSGTDPGPVRRHAALTRDFFSAGEQGVTARYSGAAAYPEVLGHYLDGFAAAGYRGEVVSAERTGERHRFEGAGRAYDLAIMAGEGGRVEVEVRELRLAARPAG